MEEHTRTHNWKRKEWRNGKPTEGHHHKHHEEHEARGMERHHNHHEEREAKGWRGTWRWTTRSTTSMTGTSTSRTTSTGTWRWTTCRLRKGSARQMEGVTEREDASPLRKRKQDVIEGR
eukprot:314213-Rhodomonas_salina.6